MKDRFNGFSLDELEERKIKKGILILETSYFDFTVIELYNILDYKIVNI